MLLEWSGDNLGCQCRRDGNSERSIEKGEAVG